MGSAMHLKELWAIAPLSLCVKTLPLLNALRCHRALSCRLLQCFQVVYTAHQMYYYSQLLRDFL
jgi:hypothetical protein